ncbi:hypothetical protein [Lacibacter sp. H407]|uniref:hypothetical protein n=1 Tax=Lacibacter sp. H407 TaxID=3133423 RepID=UPI0030BFDBC6
MKVLLLGYNYASVISSICDGNKAIGVDCRAILAETYIYKYRKYDNIETPFVNNKKTWIGKRLNTIQAYFKLYKALKNADVIHVFSDFDVSNRFFSSQQFKNYFFGKVFKGKKFVTFLGVDIRNPKIEYEVNPFYKYAAYSKNYEYGHIETENQSNRLQESFSKLGFHLISSVETEMFINPEYFPQFKICHYPSNPISKSSEESKRSEKKIRIAHAPTAPFAKGTPYVIEAIRNLEKQGITNFEFVLLKDLTVDEYLSELAKTDILIDQLIWGWYGVAAQQALSMGKIVFCYVSDNRTKYIENAPVINVNCNNLTETLISFLKKSQEEIDQIKQSGVSYYDLNHRPELIAAQFLDAYQKA